MLWNEVLDFFVRYVFGGYDSNGDIYNSFLGITYNGDDITLVDTYVSLNFFDANSESNLQIMLGNYLSLIATIITMVAILLICCLFIKKIYNMCAHIIG